MTDRGQIAVPWSPTEEVGLASTRRAVQHGPCLRDRVSNAVPSVRRDPLAPSPRGTYGGNDEHTWGAPLLTWVVGRASLARRAAGSEIPRVGRTMRGSVSRVSAVRVMNALDWRNPPVALRPVPHLIASGLSGSHRESREGRVRVGWHRASEQGSEVVAFWERPPSRRRSADALSSPLCLVRRRRPRPPTSSLVAGIPVGTARR